MEAIQELVLPSILTGATPESAATAEIQPEDIVEEVQFKSDADTVKLTPESFIASQSILFLIYAGLDIIYSDTPKGTKHHCHADTRIEGALLHQISTYAKLRDCSVLFLTKTGKVHFLGKEKGENHNKLLFIFQYTKRFYLMLVNSQHDLFSLFFENNININFLTKNKKNEQNEFKLDCTELFGEKISIAPFFVSNSNSFFSIENPAAEANEVFSINTLKKEESKQSLKNPEKKEKIGEENKTLKLDFSEKIYHCNFLNIDAVYQETNASSLCINAKKKAIYFNNLSDVPIETIQIHYQDEKGKVSVLLLDEKEDLLIKLLFSDNISAIDVQLNAQEKYENYKFSKEEKQAHRLELN